MIKSSGFALKEPYATAAKKLVAQYPKERKQSAVIGLLDLCQRQNSPGNHITEEAMQMVADMLSMSKIRVMEVASFYSMLHLKPVGKFHLQLCGTTPCMLRGACKLREAIESHLRIKEGETTPDGLFTLTEVECLGACVNAPLVQINDDYYEDLTADTMISLLDSFKAGEKKTPGPQNGRRASEPFGRKKRPQ